jgi:acyl carrier protein
MTSKLGLGILIDTAQMLGVQKATRISDEATKSVSPPLDTRPKEAVWLNRFLEYWQESSSHSSPLFEASQLRIQRDRRLITAGGWDLANIHEYSVSPKAPAEQSGKEKIIQRPHLDSALILNKIREIVAKQLGIEDQIKMIPSQSSFQNDLGADSLDVVELIMQFEEKFNLELPDEACNRLKTVGDVLAYIESVQHRTIISNPNKH